MSTLPPPVPHPTHAAQPNRLPLWRIVVAVILLAGAGILYLQEATFRVVEAAVTAHVVSWFTTGVARSATDIVYFGIGTGNVQGLLITTLCSTMILVTPLLCLGGILLLIGSFHAPRIFTGLAVAVVLAATCNMIRYAASAWALQALGAGGFAAVHRYAGSLLVIFGFIAAVLVFLRVAVGGRRRRGLTA